MIQSPILEEEGYTWSRICRWKELHISNRSSYMTNISFGVWRKNMHAWQPGHCSFLAILLNHSSQSHCSCLLNSCECTDRRMLNPRQLSLPPGPLITSFCQRWSTGARSSGVPRGCPVGLLSLARSGRRVKTSRSPHRCLRIGGAFGRSTMVGGCCCRHFPRTTDRCSPLKRSAGWMAWQPSSMSSQSGTRCVFSPYQQQATAYRVK